MLEAGEINSVKVGTAFRELEAGDIEARGETSIGQECHDGIDRACAIGSGAVNRERERERLNRVSAFGP